MKSTKIICGAAVILAMLMSGATVVHADTGAKSDGELSGPYGGGPMTTLDTPWGP